MNDELTPEEAWKLPVHRSLTQPNYWMGVPRGILLLEFLGLILGGIIFKTFIVIPVVIGIHFLFRYFGQKDPMFLDVFLRSLQRGNYYSN
ncbi:MAG: VirB3 family type IV secretion system protein [Acidaminococcaceae bacterium]|jgi:type IV secretion system protein VirB3|nr:VirB3 family type IV secretion system protein [Acidaminococcaceae bacterium]